MGKKGGARHKAAGLSSLVRAEEAAEEEILETPALSGFAGNDNDASDSEEDDEDEEAEAEMERQLVEDKLREEAAAQSAAENKGVYHREAIAALVAEWDGERALPWVEHLDTCAAPLELDSVHDDLKREVAFYNNTVASVRAAKDRLKREGIAYKRPEDYFAEMLKSDAHMAKVKDKLIYEQKKIAAVEERKKSQAHRKVAKELQAEKIKQRTQQKKDTLDAVKQWKKRKAGDSKGLQDTDDQQLENIMRGEGDVNSFGKRKRGADGNDHRDSKKPRVNLNKGREARDKKYGFGGKKRGLKNNSRESTNDMSRFPGAHKANKGKPAAAVRAAAAKGTAPKGKRAGKAARASQRSKGRR
jgi:rRNA-processing protein EBP2